MFFSFVAITSVSRCQFCEMCRTPVLDSDIENLQKKIKFPPKRNLPKISIPNSSWCPILRRMRNPILNISEKSHAKKPNYSKKKICPQCGKPVEADATFCEECGNSNWKSAKKVEIKKVNKKLTGYANVFLN